MGEEPVVTQLVSLGGSEETFGDGIIPATWLSAHAGGHFVGFELGLIVMTRVGARFNWSSQHLDDEVLECRNRSEESRTAQDGQRCVLQDALPKPGLSNRSSSGGGLQKAYQARRLPLCVVRPRLLEAVCFAGQAVCRQLAWRPARLVTCRFRNARKSPFYGRREKVYARLLVRSVGTHQRFLARCGAMPRRVLAGCSTEHRVPSGTAIVAPSAPRSLSSRAMTS